VASLFHRGLKLSSNKEYYLQERNIIIKDLVLNGYPIQFITKIEKQIKEKINTNTTQNKTVSTNANEIHTRESLPYHQNWSEQISRICYSFGIAISFKPMNKFSSFWGKQKSKMPSHKNINAIYQINCLDCKLSYFGESNNSTRRMKEHEADIRLSKPDNSALAKHTISLGHQIDLANHIILANDPFYLTRKLTESYFIQSHQEVINKHPGSLPAIYLNSPLFKNFTC
jgi:hypothetical protein